MESLPPIQYLPAFHWAAHHLSFKKAAEELGVTPSAISQQIKLLEESLGETLFKRLTRKVELTEAGSAYKQVVGETLKIFEQGHESFQMREEVISLLIAVPNYFAQQVLKPLLPNFHQTYPNIEVRLRGIKDNASKVDGTITYGAELGAETAHLLMTNKLSICLSPDLQQSQALSHPQQIEQQRLIYCGVGDDEWLQVAKAINKQNLVSEDKKCKDYQEGIAAAEAGEGLLLALFPLMEHLVLERRLVKPFPALLKTDKQFYLQPNKSGKNTEALSVFVKWLKKALAEKY